ncbi:MAG: short-chain dehydrogenase [Minwuia thermotolerans]|nr:MAG: short-chain dehydrogenase [Minwuia thermotolerans]
MSKTILITGAGRGIGRQLALQSLESGASVIACARRIGDLDDLVAKGAEAQALEVTDLDAINSLKAALGDRPIDILFNNAGIIGPDRQAIGDMDIDGWRETMEVNVYAPYRVSEALVDNVAASDHRTIVVVSSKMGSMSLNTVSDRFIYRSSKAAVNQVVVCMANEWRPRGVRVVATHPGWVSTDMGGAAAPVTPAESAAGLLKVANGMTDEASGRFWNYDGEELSW